MLHVKTDVPILLSSYCVCVSGIDLVNASLFMTLWSYYLLEKGTDNKCNEKVNYLSPELFIIFPN